MNLSQWEIMGSHQIENFKTGIAARKIFDIYELHSSGSLLHNELDDWNLEHFDESNVARVWADKDKDTEDDLFELCLDVALLFSLMTLEERVSALGMAKGHFRSDEFMMYRD